MTPPPPAPPNVILLGVVIDNGEARAIVQAGPANEILRVRIGDDISGWKVTQIESAPVGSLARQPPGDFYYVLTHTH